MALVRVRMWTDLHFSNSPDYPVNLILVERLEPTGKSRIMPPLWLVWTGERTMPLEEIWHQYRRRFGIEHWYRFARAAIGLDYAEFKNSRTM